MLQAKINERSDVLSRLVDNVPRLIREQFNQYNKEAEDEARANCDGDMEVYWSMYRSFLDAYCPEDESWMVEEFYRSMVMSICSFAEGMVKGELKNPNQVFRGNYLCCSFNQVNREKNLGLKRIGVYWPGHKAFIKMRNDIAHSRRNVIVTPTELYDAIRGVHNLLRAMADAIAAKNVTTPA